MEPQTIIYIIAGIAYFLYSLKKAADERKQNQASTPSGPKPVTAPSTFGDILKEIKRQQEISQAKKPRPVPPPAEPKRTKPKPVSVMEEMKRAAALEESAATEEAARVERAKKEQAIYHIKSEEELAKSQREEQTAYQFDAREALIGSIIFERKY